MCIRDRIGILRAIGASKRDISRVFNAETLIEGFCSGAIGIGITPVSYTHLGGKVYENLLETLVLENERGESMYPWLDGNYRSCTSSRGTVYVHRCV